MKNTIRLAIIAASMLAAPYAMAEKGLWEISIAGNVENSTNEVDVAGGTSSSSQTNTFINADVGRYFTTKLVGRVSVGMFGSESGGSKTTGTTVGAGVKYYFGEPAKSQWVPFVNGGVNIVVVDSAGTSFTGAGLAGGGGVSYFISEQVSADASLQLFYNFLSSSNFDMTQSGSRVLFGLTARY